MNRLTSQIPRSALLAAFGVALGALLFVGCDSTGPSVEDGSAVEVGFRIGSSSTQPNAVGPKASAGSLTLTGTNGDTLRITDLRLIVSEMELEGDADSAEFETERPSLLTLPLNDTDVAPLVTDVVPPGRYNEFEFEVEDVELDDDDDETELQALRDEIQSDFTDWPSEGSMVAVGTFTPEGGEPQSFTTYFQAELEVEREMERPFEIGGDGTARRLTVELSPSEWFTREDGSVWNLAQLDYASTSELVEFEAEFEDGVTEVDFDD